MPKLVQQVNRLIILIIIFSVGLLCTLWFKESGDLAREREQNIAWAIQRNNNLVLALENYAVRTIENADILLNVVRNEIEDKNFTGYERLLRSQPTDVKLFKEMAIIDKEGNLISSSFASPADSHYNFKEREYFQYHLNNNDDKLYISKPIISKILHVPIICFTRRINNADGSFYGIAVLQIPPATFMAFYEKAIVNDKDIVSLISPDGITYARQTGLVKSFGEDISKSPLFKHVAENPVGNYEAKDAIKNIYTYFSYRKLKNYPIIATVGISREDALAPYRERQSRELIFVIVISLLIILFTIFYCLGIIKRKRNLRALKASEESYRLMFQNNRDAIILFLGGGKILAVNPAAHEVFKIKGDDRIVRNVSELLDKDAGNGINKEQGLLQGGSFTGEVVFRRADDSTFIADVVSSSYHDAVNNKIIVAVIRDTTARRELEEALATERNSRQQLVTRQVIQAQERERQIIGAELHDNICQILSTVKIYLGMIQSSGNAASDLLPESISLVDMSISEIRDLSHKLSAPSLGTRSLINAMKDLVASIHASGAIGIDFQYDDNFDAAGIDEKLAIFRILQEQMNNILKHADATEVAITLTRENNNMKLVIADNGRGFDPAQKSKGIGMSNMEARVKAFSGSFTVTTSPGKGCTVEVNIPTLHIHDTILAETQRRGEMQTFLRRKI